MSAEFVRAPSSGRTFLGHPIGLAYLAFTEAFERFSFYGMQALLVLYMINQLLKPGHVEHVAGFSFLRGMLESGSGHLSPQALASQIFGLYAACVYLTPMFGGILGDRILGRTRAVTTGAVLMAAGHFLMALEQAFIAALLLLIVGCGLVKGNIASQVGGLYEEKDALRRTDAFQIFLLSVGAGVIAAPLVCGSLGETIGWHYGFAAAGVGMLVGLSIYLAGRKFLPPDRFAKAPVMTTAALSLTRHDWPKLLSLTALLPILAIAFVGNNQIYNAYIVWAKENADLSVFGWQMPVTWLFSFDAAVSAVFAAMAIVFWHWMDRHKIEPHELTKLLLGCAISIAGFAILAIAAATQGRGGIPLILLLAFHVVNAIGEVNLLPVALSLFSRAAPPAANATMIGVLYLLFFVTNLMVGWIGGLYETMPHTSFWLLHAGLCAASTLALTILYRPLMNVLK